MVQRRHRFAARLILILAPALATAQSDRPEPDALRGLSTVDLVAEAFGELPDPKQASLAMRTAIEARLGLNGIKAEYDASKAATLPRIHLVAYAVRSDDFKHYAYDVSLSVSRMVQMSVPPENRNTNVRATVWRKSVLRIVLPGN
ncbi:MAG TPA: hypothetical protein VFO21_00410, partial [Vicinamibacterales bacterium]|nr:hypothetical protein [Vicinamibacterales bacterium]